MTSCPFVRPHRHKGHQGHHVSNAVLLGLILCVLCVHRGEVALEVSDSVLLAGLTGEASNAGRNARTILLARLPATVHAFILVELQVAPAVCPRTALSARTARTPLAFNRDPSWDERCLASGASKRKPAPAAQQRAIPARFQDEAQALFRRRGQTVAWRPEVDGFFQRSAPALDHSSIPPMRRAAWSFSSMAAASRSSARNCGAGSKAPASVYRWTLEGPTEPNVSPGAVRSARRRGAPRRRFRASAVSASAPLDAWLVESHEALPRICATQKAEEHQPAR